MGHIARTEDKRWTNAMMKWYPRVHTRRKGRPKYKLETEMTLIAGGPTWQRVAGDRKEWDYYTGKFG